MLQSSLYVFTYIHIYVYIYICIPRTSGDVKLTLDLETPLIIALSFIYRRFPELSPLQVRAPVETICHDARSSPLPSPHTKSNTAVCILSIRSHVFSLPLSVSPHHHKGSNIHVFQVVMKERKEVVPED